LNLTTQILRTVNKAGRTAAAAKRRTPSGTPSVTSVESLRFRRRPYKRRDLRYLTRRSEDITVSAAQLQNSRSNRTMYCKNNTVARPRNCRHSSAAFDARARGNCRPYIVRHSGQPDEGRAVLSGVLSRRTDGHTVAGWWPTSDTWPPPGSYFHLTL